MAGAVMQTGGALLRIIPAVVALTRSLRSLAVVQAIVTAFTPGGAIKLVGAAVAGGAAVYGINKALGSAGGGGNNITIINNNVQGSMIAEKELGARNREDLIRQGRRNSSTGVNAP